MKFLKTFLMVLAAVVAVFATPACAQELKFPPDLERLAAKASEVVDINMDRRMLDFAMRFMDAEGDAEGRALLKKLKGVYVKSFEFDKPGQYTTADVEPFRAQLRGPQWSKMMNARSKRDGENVELFVRLDSAGIAQGMAIVTEAPQELTLISIEGPIDPAEISELGGQFGIPKIETPKKPATKPASNREVKK